MDFAAGEKRSWLHAMGVRWFPLVGWAERGGYLADGHGNSVSRFHVTWGTGPGLVAPLERRVRDAAAAGLVEFGFRHRVDELTVSAGAVDGVRGAVLEPRAAARGTRSSRTETGEFELHAPVVIITSGGLGGNHDLVRENWPERLGPAPERMLSGVPEHVDGRMLAIAERAGARLVRKTLGGLQTGRAGRVLGTGLGTRADPVPSPVPGLYAAGEVAGFGGGGGMHGYRSLEGSFLGGCLFSGRQAGRAAVRETGG